MNLIDITRKDIEKDETGKLKAYTLNIMMLEPVVESNKYYIKRNIKWKFENGHTAAEIPSNYGLKHSNNNTYMLVKYIFGINEIFNDKTVRIECLSEEVSVEYTPDVDEYFATARHLYLNLPKYKL